VDGDSKHLICCRQPILERGCRLIEGVTQDEN
jgi:hypothetical protein